MKKKKKDLLNSLIVKAPFADGMLSLASRARQSRSMIILTYHQIAEKNPFLPDWCCLPVDHFAEQMAHLSDHFEVFPLLEGLEELKQRRRRKRPLAALTFDDGFYNNYSHAFPILRTLGLPATIFLASGFIDGNDTVWFCRLNKALHGATGKGLQWRDKNYSIATIADKVTTFRELQMTLKKLPHDTLQEELGIILRSLGDRPDTTIDPLSIYRMLDSDAISRMLRSGLIDFGAHTRDHVVLSHVSPEVQHQQIQCSVNDVRALTGRENVTFAYPNGGIDDYNTSSINELRKSGVNCALTMIPGINYHNTPALELKRIGVGGDWGIGVFRFALHTGYTAKL